jgi:hypothetical protein
MATKRRAVKKTASRVPNSFTELGPPLDGQDIIVLTTIKVVSSYDDLDEVGRAVMNACDTHAVAVVDQQLIRETFEQAEAILEKQGLKEFVGQRPDDM